MQDIKAIKVADNHYQTLRSYVKAKKIFLTEPTKVTESIDFIDSFLCVLRALCEKFMFYTIPYP